jgi:alpha-beta hydrolase superfamily lysophospholipase
MVRRILKRAAVVVCVSAVTLLAIRAWDSERGPDLEPWHTYGPHEPSRSELSTLDWDGYVAAESRVFEEVRDQVTRQLEPDERIPANRYFEGSPVHPASFAQDWNRSFLWMPDAAPIGAVVLLHGLTDSPYSVRHVARRYLERGFVAVAIRLPGHGTVPGGLADTEWEDWVEATRLAVREARHRAGPSVPLHLVGYSTGGALALEHALDAIEDSTLARPDRIVLLSPMIGITAFARFAGLLGIPAVFPAFAKAAWLSVLPEFNPFKYNSFPVNAARQSSLLARRLQQEIARRASDGQLGALPPIVTFQSVVDFTVSTPAIVSSLYAELPSNGSEFVLFDLNRRAKLGLLLRPDAETALDRLLPAAPRRYATTIVTNAGSESGEVEARTLAAGATAETEHLIGLAYPSGVFSLSHVAVPFPPTDGLYGSQPDPLERFGVHLGNLDAQGERGTLIVSLDFLSRTASNPFFPYLLERIDEGILDVSARALASDAPTGGARSVRASQR